MSVRRRIREYDGVYFITITCARWLHLFEYADGYDPVYRWFDYLKAKSPVMEISNTSTFCFRRVTVSGPCG
jgi:hypothetical protein